MKQSRTMSLVEAIANVVVGYGIAVVTQIAVFPIFGLHVSLAQNLGIGGVFTIVSIARLAAPDDFVRYEPGSGVQGSACAPGNSCPFEFRVRRLPEALDCAIMHDGSFAPRHELRSDRDGFIRRSAVTADAADDPGVKIELRDLRVIIPESMPEGRAGYRLTTCHLGCPGSRASRTASPAPGSRSSSATTAPTP